MRNEDRIEAARQKVREWGASIAQGRWDWHALGHALELCRDAIRDEAGYQRGWTLIADVYHLAGRDDLAHAALARSYELASPGPNRPGDFYRSVRNRVETGEPFQGQTRRQAPPGWFEEKYAELLAEPEVLMRRLHAHESPRVFVVHGRDLDTLEKVELALRRVGAEPRILARLVFPGLTIIEALESELPRADAVVCLFTPDDEGRRKGETELKPRARQNVLVEAGHAVIGMRRRSVIVALGGVEIRATSTGSCASSTEHGTRPRRSHWRPISGRWGSPSTRSARRRPRPRRRRPPEGGEP